MTKSRILFILLIISLLGNCGQNVGSAKSQKFSRLAEYLKQKHSYVLDTSKKVVFIISDAGCFSCNKRFSNFAANNSNNAKVVFIITANETNLDLSLFSKSNGNVFYDSSSGKDKWLKQSGAMIIGSGKVDSTVVIDAKDIDSQIGYIEQALSFQYH